MGYRNPLTILGRAARIIGSQFATGYPPATRIEIGPQIPTGLKALNIASAIVFYQTGGAYLALATNDNGANPNLIIYYGASDAASPVELSRVIGLPASPALNRTTIDTDLGLALSKRLLPALGRTGLSFSGGIFVNFGTGYGPGSYTVDATGWVKLQGLAYNPTGGAASAGAIVTTGLPVPASGLTEALPMLIGTSAPILLQVDGTTGLLTILAGSCPGAQNIVLSGGYQS